MPLSGFAKSAMTAVSGISVGIALAFGLAYARPSEPQGEANAHCDKFPEPSVSNGKGTTVSSHITACTTLGTSMMSYVYVHPSDQVPTEKNLVFVYSASDNGKARKVEWVGEHGMVIQVDQVGFVSKIMTNSGASTIGYRINGH